MTNNANSSRPTAAMLLDVYPRVSNDDGLAYCARCNAQDGECTCLEEDALYALKGNMADDAYYSRVDMVVRGSNASKVRYRLHTRTASKGDVRKVPNSSLRVVRGGYLESIV